MTPQAFDDAARQAQANGARFPLRAGESLTDLLARLARCFFDPEFDPIVTSKTPGAGKDILQASANNLYRDVTMADLEGFEERYPLNSRLVKRDGQLVEEVYRVGGRYDTYIREIVRHLRAAVPFATPPMAAALQALIRFYETGESADRVAYDIAWVHDRDSPVDTINGFVEVYMDARGVKGAWEALVYYVNPHKTQEIRKLAAAAQWFEDRMPWDDDYKKQRRARHLRQRHRRRRRDGGLGAGHAGRHQPAQRPDDPRGARQQVGVAVERQRTPTTSRRCPSSAASSPGATRKRRAPRSGAASPPS